MKITVRIERVYGTRRIYPVCEKAKAFAKLIGNKCITEAQCEIIMSLGFEIDTASILLVAKT